VVFSFSSEKARKGHRLKETSLLYINPVTLTWPQGMSCCEIIPATAGPQTEKQERIHEEKGADKRRNTK
jgi:hypothetical protein